MDTTTYIKEFLNQYLFDKVWNEPYKEYRRNIVPVCPITKPCIGLWSYRTEKAVLPTQDMYYVYMLSKSVFNNINVDINDRSYVNYYNNSWIKLDEFLTDRKFTMRIHGRHGQMLHRGSIYIKEGVDNDTFLIAVNKNMFRRILGYDYDVRNIYVALYFDSDSVNNISVRCWKPLNTDELNTVANICYNADKSISTVYVDGIARDVNVITEFKLYDYIELVTDPNIKGIFELDLSVDDDNRQYTSSVTSGINQIIHVPKTLNPNNQLITHNTCDVYIRNKQQVNANYKWYLIHRANSATPFVQLTHNDFAIPQIVIDSYKSMLSTSEVVLKVQIRDHEKNNHLIRDCNYVDYLYLHDDKTICDFLEHDGPIDFEFWSAQQLETSGYVKLMFNPVDRTSTSADIVEYVNALGCLNTLSLICNRVREYSKDSLRDNGLPLALPMLYYDKEVYPIFHIDGLKVKDTLVTCTRPSSRGLQVDLDDSIVLGADAQIVLELFEDTPLPVYQFIPSVDARTLAIPYTQYVVYYKDTLNTPVRGVDKIYTECYLLTTEYSLSNGVLTFNPTLYGKTCIVQPVDNDYHLSVDIDSYLTNGLDVAIDLICSSTSSTSVPIFTENKSVVYLNGHALIENLDYSIVTIARNEKFIMKQLVMQNMSYLKNSDNYLEIFVTNLQQVSRQNGNVINTKFVLKDDQPLWFDQMSTLIVDGKAVKDVRYNQARLSVENFVPRNGAVFELRTMYTRTVAKFLEQYPVQADYDRYKSILVYLYGMDDYPAQTVVIPKSHWIYSIFTNTIVRDVVTGTLVLTYEPDDTKVLDQVVDYIYLKAHDIAFKMPPDFGYVDVFPIYKQMQIGDPGMYRNVKRLLSIALPKDTILDENYSSGGINQ